MKIDLMNAALFSRTLFRANDAKNRDGHSPGTREKTGGALSFDFSQQVQSAAEARKAAAYQRMAQLKSRLESLMKYSLGSVNPRLVAQLAKELKSLIAQYGSAGGVSMPVALNGPAMPQSGQAAAEQGAHTADKPPTEAPVAAEAVEKQVPSEAEMRKALTALASVENASSKLTGEDAAKTPLNNSIENSRNKETGSAADREFFAEARKLARMIKALLRKNREREAADPQEAKDIREAKKAIREMEDTIGQTEREMMAGQTFASDLTYQPDATPAPESIGSVSTFISTYA